MADIMSTFGTLLEKSKNNAIKLGLKPPSVYLSYQKSFNEYANDGSVADEFGIPRHTNMYMHYISPNHFHSSGKKDEDLNKHIKDVDFVVLVGYYHHPNEIEPRVLKEWEAIMDRKKEVENNQSKPFQVIYITYSSDDVKSLPFKPDLIIKGYMIQEEFIRTIVLLSDVAMFELFKVLFKSEESHKYCDQLWAEYESLVLTGKKPANIFS